MNRAAYLGVRIDDALRYERQAIFGLNDQYHSVNPVGPSYGAWFN